MLTADFQSLSLGKKSLAPGGSSYTRREIDDEPPIALTRPY
ncbi:hypothetical protein COLO4_02783 [Corchorus olitorius]|uniref:Uncharacterized protein n=1 Tax=Corchorus olitorius TaxID=93759 RepID=A0A1R3L0D5_9ROSI|nr:hypothetical protein COLO4_02783 [Corchorus olitorius]